MKSYYSKSYILQLIVFWAILFSSKGIFAQDVRFTLRGPEVVAVGERFRVSYAINEQGTNMETGKFEGLKVLSGPNRSTSTSVQIVNGQTTQSIEVAYNYILVAEKEGTFYVPAAKITFEGKNYNSNTLKVKVVKGRQNNSRSPGAATSGNNATTPEASISSEDLLLRMLLSKREAMQGEPIIATLKMYTRINLANLGNYKTPAFNGFWSEILQQAQQIRFKREEYNGQIYNTAIIQQHVLIPERTGDLTIEPAELTAIAQIPIKSRSRRGFFDDFYQRYQNVEKTLKSPSASIKINPLPAGAPASFNGAVGNMKLSASLDPQETKTNEAVALKITYSGTGNLKLIAEPDLKFPSDFEVYDPKVSTNFKANVNGFSGNKTYEYLLIPRHEGDFEIPALNFAVFDLTSKTYKNFTAGPFPLKVEKGEGGENITGFDLGMMKEDVRELGSDIRFIRVNNFALQKKGQPFFGSLSFYLSYLIGLILFFIVLYLARQQRKRSEDVVYMKNKKAGRLAQSKLKEAKLMMDKGDTSGFYKETVNALWSYLGDKLNIPQGELSKEKVRTGLANKGVGEDMIQEYIRLVDQCEFAQFAPGGANEKMANLYGESIQLINQLEQTLK